LNTSTGGRRDALLCLILATLPLFAYAPAWRAHVLLGPGDGIALHLPLRTEAWRALQRGEVPSWNPSSFSGTPLLAAYRAGPFHPLMIALAPLDPFSAFQILVLVSLALTAPIGFVYARRVGAGPLGAAVAGLGFALGPYLVGHLGDTPTVVAAPALLLTLLAVEAHVARPRATTATFVAFATALLLLAGSTEAVGAGALLVGGRLLVAAGRTTQRRLGGPLLGALGGIAAGVLLAAPQLVPTLVALGEAGQGRPGAAQGPGAALGGVIGFVIRTVSHTPAPVFALAALPLLRERGALRLTAGAALALGLALGVRGEPSEAGALPLALDLVLALLAGLSLSTQWRWRLEPRGRRLRLLTAVVALFAAVALSVATSLTGPLPQDLAGPVGLLALGLIFYVLLGGSRRTVTAHVFVLPLAAAFLLQPWGRHAWRGAPTPAALEEGSPTRRAIDHVMGPRRRERTLSIAQTWPGARADDLGWANLATVIGRRNVEGYDPLVPASRREALDGMRADGTLPVEFLETDPGRLELLGVRWVQVPTSSLVVPVDEAGLGDAVDVILEPPRPRLFALPFTDATEVRIESFLSGATGVSQGEIVAECVAQTATGREIWLPIRAGVDTAEWAWERADVRDVVRHRRAPILESFPVHEGFSGHKYLGVLRLPGRFAVAALRFRAWPDAPPLTLLRVGIRDEVTGRASGVALASGYLSDEVRLRKAAGTPFVTLFEVRRGVGPAWVVESLRRLPGADRVADFLRSPTRLGVDSRREALAVERDVEGVTLPPGSRSSRAVLAQAVGGRMVVRAAGPGLLVTSEGWDAGWSVRVDGDPERVVRVNGDRLGVVLAEGTHRVVFRHHARGLGVGIGLALVGAASLLFALARGRRRRGRIPGSLIHSRQGDSRIPATPPASRASAR
jgi:hypothetical protein